MDLKEIKTMLTKLKELPDVEKNSSQTLFDIAGFPRRETVCSNFFAFFLDVSGEHGLKDLFLKSLLEAYFEKSDGELPPTAHLSTQIKKEEYTKEGGFIDILIETEDFAIIIENKIDADLYNDLNDYFDSAKSSGKYAKIHAIVLSLNKFEDIEKSNDGDAEFCNIIYADFVRKLKGNLGEYMSDANGEWIIIMKNFIKLLQNLERKKNIMSNEEYKKQLEFIADADNIEGIKALERLFKSTVDFMEKELEKVEDEIKTFGDYSFKHGKATTGLTNPWVRSRYDFRKNVFAETSDNNFFEIIRCAKGWEMRFWAGSGNKEINDKAKESLKGINAIDQNCTSLVEKDNSYAVTLWVYEPSETNTLNPKNIAEEAHELIDKINEGLIKGKRK